MQYSEESDEHIVEVIYNVKNYSADKSIDQQWVQSISLPKSLKFEIQNDGIKGSNKNLSFQIEAINVKDLTVKGVNSTIKLSNSKSFKLGTKERLSWKVLYKLKSID